MPEYADIGYCRRWMEQRTPGLFEDYIEVLRIRTETFLQPRERAVRAIAAALLRKKTLDALALAQTFYLLLFVLFGNTATASTNG